MDFPITQAQFEAWLAGVAVMEPGRTFTSVGVSRLCIMEEACRDAGHAIVLVGIQTWARGDRSAIAPEWVKETAGWYDNFGLRGCQTVTADVLWIRYCQWRGIPLPPDARARQRAVEQVHGLKLPETLI